MGRSPALEEQLNTSPKSAQDDSTVIDITPAAPAKQQHGRWLRTAQVGVGVEATYSVGS